MMNFGQLCCCSKSVEEYVNTTLLTDFGCSGFSAPNVAPYTHPDIDCVCDGHTPTAAGPWPVPPPAQTFADSGSKTTLNTCPQHGQKGVHAHRWVNGRPGFQGTSRFQKISTQLSYSEEASGYIKYYDSGGGLVAEEDKAGTASCSASSSNNVTHWGVPQQEGVSGFDGGSGDGIVNLFAKEMEDVYYNFPLFLSFYDPISPFSPYPGAESMCYADVDCAGALHLVTPWGNFSGPPSDLPAWVAAMSGAKNQPLFYAGDFGGMGWLSFDYATTYSLTTFSLTNTTIDVVIKLVSHAHLFRYAGDDPTTPGYLIHEVNQQTANATFTIHAQLDDENTFPTVDADAKTLLNAWNMADDKTWDYAWGTGNCQIQPMVTRRELGYVKPVPGYLPTITDSTVLAALAVQLAYYDGSIVGAPLSSYRQSDGAYTPGGLTNWPNGYYSTGWFDFSALIFNYTPSPADDGTLQLCYGYGSYAPSGLPSQTTQFTYGGLDTCTYGGAWEPFSRYKVSYVLVQMPPFVWGGGAFVAGCNGNEIFVSKYAEIKEPLPSQNFWAPTSVQPNQAATDNHVHILPDGTPSVAWLADPMRDLDILATDCTDTGTKRYPPDATPATARAVPIAGRAACTFHDNGDGTFNATATAPQLRVGDVVDFINGTSAVITANLAVTSLVTGGFKFTGAVPTGASFMVSHGHAGDWQWFDITPKGDFVLAFFTNTATGLTNCQPPTGYTSEATAIQCNVQPKGQKYAVICICPPGSPELTDSRWSHDSIYFFTDYPMASAFFSWQCNIVQGMLDRFWIARDDAMTSEPVDGVDTCFPKNTDGSPCDDPVLIPCDPILKPMVEARLTAPVGAPLQFTTASADRWLAMPTQDSFSIQCSGIWNYGEKMQPFTKPLDPPSNPATPSAGDANTGAGDNSGGGLI